MHCKRTNIPGAVSLAFRRRNHQDAKDRLMASHDSEINLRVGLGARRAARASCGGSRPGGTLAMGRTEPLDAMRPSQEPNSQGCRLRGNCAGTTVQHAHRSDSGHTAGGWNPPHSAIAAYGPPAAPPHYPTQNPVRLKPREGSTPSSGTNFVRELRAREWLGTFRAAWERRPSPWIGQHYTTGDAIVSRRRGLRLRLPSSRTPARLTLEGRGLGGEKPPNGFHVLRPDGLVFENQMISTLDRHEPSPRNGGR